MADAGRCRTRGQACYAFARRNSKVTKLGPAPAENGTLSPTAVRRVEAEALVDTGAITLVLPRDVVDALGLPIRERKAATLADGSTCEVGRVTGVRVEILGRDMTTDALVVPSVATPLIGQLQLEFLDLVVDARGQEVRTNPRSPDVRMFDMLRVA